MSDNITVQITGSPTSVLKFLSEMRQAAAAEQPKPWWMTENPWFEQRGKLTPEEAADMEAAFYGKGSGE